MTRGLLQRRSIIPGALAESADEVLEDDGEFFGIDMLGGIGRKR